MELMRMSNKFDKIIQEMNGEIFHMIEAKSENFGLLQNLLREKEEIIKKKRESLDHDSVGNPVMLEKLRILQEILSEFRPTIKPNEQGHSILIHVANQLYKI